MGNMHEPQGSPGTDFEARSSGEANGKAGKMPAEGGEIMDIDYFSEHVEGKKKRRRGRLIIFVDESEERTRWVPWVLLAALIIGAAVAAVLIIRFAVNNSKEGPSSAARKRVTLGEPQGEQIADCASLMLRLRETSQEYAFSPSTAVSSRQTRWSQGTPLNRASTQDLVISGNRICDIQHDVLVPLGNDTVNMNGTPLPAVTPSYSYTASGTQLMVIEIDGDAATPANVVARVDLSMLDAFQFSASLDVSDDLGTMSIPYGLGATFQVEQLFLPPPATQRIGGAPLLAVIGSATNAAPVFPGPSPNLNFDAVEERLFIAPDLRPFNTTVVVMVDVSDPLNPSPVSITEYEGVFVTIAAEAAYYWVFIKSSAHVPANHQPVDDSKLTIDVMPLFRNLPVSAVDGLESMRWQHMSDCANVTTVEVGVSRNYPNFLMVSVPIPVNQSELGRDVEPQDLQLFIQGWPPEMTPIITGAGERLNLYAAESLSAPPSSSSGTASSTVDSGTSSIKSVVSHFELTEGNMNWSTSTIADGELRFDGAMHFLDEDRPRLSLLTSQESDDNSGAIVHSNLAIYDRELESEEFQRTNQFRGRQPTSVLYPTDKHVFISFAYEAAPQVQVLPTQNVSQAPSPAARSGETPRGDSATSQPQQGVQRLFTNEFLDLIKGMTVANSDEDDDPAYVLVIAGRKKGSADGDRGTVTQPTAAMGRQFSIYFYRPGFATQIQAVTTVNITSGELQSEAFMDPRAAVLFQVPGDGVGRTNFALPVVITQQTDLLSSLGCIAAQGFSGTLIWSLVYEPTAQPSATANITVQPIAAIPSTGTCGWSPGAQYDDVAVKRIRVINSGMGLQLISLSRCHMATVAWGDIIATNSTAATNMPEPWNKVIPNKPQMLFDDCPTTA